LIEQNPHVLEEIDLTPFVETPLHVAAQHVQFAKEIMILKPSFSWKFNPQGFRLVHLALQHGHDRMVLHDGQRTRLSQKERMSHSFAFGKSIGRYKSFNCLGASSDSIKDLTVRSETALHLYERFEIFDFLLR